jgi:hypothetical protein
LSRRSINLRCAQLHTTSVYWPGRAYYVLKLLRKRAADAEHLEDFSLGLHDSLQSLLDRLVLRVDSSTAELASSETEYGQA